MLNSPFHVLNHIIDGGVVAGVTPDTWAGELLEFDQVIFKKTHTE